MNQSRRTVFESSWRRLNRNEFFLYGYDPRQGRKEEMVFSLGLLIEPDPFGHKVTGHDVRLENDGWVNASHHYHHYH
jgi:hypothetical protein